MPSDYVVNVTDDGFGPGSSKRTNVVSFENGVFMSFSVMVSDYAATSLGRIYIDKSRSPKEMDFKFDRFEGKIVTTDRNEYDSCIYLANGSNFYSICVKAASKEIDVVGRFLTSIKLGGKPLLSKQNAVSNGAGEPIVLEKLKSSIQVVEALKRDVGKYRGTVTFEPLSAFKDCKSDWSIRPPLLISHIYPRNTLDFRDIQNGGEVKIKLQLMASGAVGDIIIYSDVDKAVLRSYAESARKARFVAASLNGVSIDACAMERSSFGITRSAGIIIVK